MTRAGHRLIARMARLIPTLLVAACAAGAAAQTPDQVQYLPRDRSAVILWNGVANATGYHVYQYTLSSPTADPSDPVRVTPEPVKTPSLLVENLKNGQAYHFRVSAIVDGQESEKVGPAPAGAAGDSDGIFAPVVPQEPTTTTAGEAFRGHTIGTNYPGSHEVDADGAIALKASGWDIWLQADGFYFLAVPMDGDITVTVRCVSGPTATEDSNGWNLGGPMIRESLDSRSRFALMQIARERQLQFKKRLDFNESPQNDGLERDDNTLRPVWLRLQRQKDVFKAWWSEDGNTYEQLGDTEGVTISGFAEKPFVGLALSAHEDKEYSTAVFDNFKITKP